METDKLSVLKKELNRRSFLFQVVVSHRKALRLFLGDVQEQRPSDYRKALRLFWGTCGSSVPPISGKPCGFFGGRAGAASLRFQESLAAFFGGRAGTASLRLQESLAAFLGDVQEQRPSDFRKALRLFGGTCRSNVPPRHGMRGTKTCISECGIGRMLTDKIVRFCFRCKKCVNYSTFIRAKKRIFAPEYGFCQLHFAKRTANHT